MKFFVSFLFLCIPLAQSQAASFVIAPIIGYELLQRTTPSAHTKGMLVFGGRLVYGTRELAGEFEFLHGSDSESFTNPTLGLSTQINLIRLGARSIQPLAQNLDLILRAGVQAYQFSLDSTVANGVTQSSSSWTYRPYGGAGLEVFVSQNFSLLGEGVYVFNSLSNLGQNWLELSFGFKLYF